jgi:hypothetical protein
MSDGAERWREAGRSWNRLSGWQKRHRSGGGDPLEALSDIGLVRRMLDEAELDAVRGARRRRSSWAEIAIRLGVTRQSAWERWRELDEEPPAPPAEAVPGRAAREARRRATVTVPQVVGMAYDEALHLLAGRGLVGVPHDPAGPSSTHGMPGAVVVDQSPESGAVVEPGTPVTLWTESDGGSGVREPRRPKPTPLAVRGHEEPSEEAVG